MKRKKCLILYERAYSTVTVMTQVTTLGRGNLGLPRGTNYYQGQGGYPAANQEGPGLGPGHRSRGQPGTLDPN